MEKQIIKINEQQTTEVLMMNPKEEYIQKIENEVKLLEQTVRDVVINRTEDILEVKVVIQLSFSTCLNYFIMNYYSQDKMFKELLLEMYFRPEEESCMRWFIGLDKTCVRRDYEKEDTLVIINRFDIEPCYIFFNYIFDYQWNNALIMVQKHKNLIITDEYFLSDFEDHLYCFKDTKRNIEAQEILKLLLLENPALYPKTKKHLNSEFRRELAYLYTVDDFNII